MQSKGPAESPQLLFTGAWPRIANF